MKSRSNAGVVGDQRRRRRRTPGRRRPPRHRRTSACRRRNASGDAVHPLRRRVDVAVGVDVAVEARGRSGSKSSISTQAISISRWPPCGSRPVVSVSRTISRAMALQCACFGAGFKAATRRQSGIAQGGDDLAHLGAGGVQALAGVDHEVGPGALLGVGHLAGEDARRAWPRSCPGGPAPARAAPRPGARDHHHRVDVALAAGLEQQRDVEHHRSPRRLPRPCGRSSRRAAPSSGWTMLFSRFSASGSPSTRARRACAVDRAVLAPRPGRPPPPAPPPRRPWRRGRCTSASAS